ncbi:MAG: sodium:calcium antiporter [Capsulimonas sp.]|uniref:sodium:calcium antiporter n=1 Tax=Capsulimonas sp. TaxID=2494211 RepID=UPI0032665160
MFQSVSLPFLILIFGFAAAIVWKAGVIVSDTVDDLSKRLHLGEALGGLIVLAIVTNLPEIAITATAALHHDIGIAVGNILGGIAIQTVVLVLLDARIRDPRPLTSQIASIMPALEGILVVTVLIAAIMGAQMPSSVVLFRLTPEDILITVFWVVGVVIIAKARKHLPWRLKENEGAPRKPAAPQGKERTLAKASLLFAAGAAATLIAGLVLEQSGEVIAHHIHLSGLLFGATALAAATALPEISTGLEAVKLGDYELAVGDIFGGNAFLPVLFLLATLLSGRPALPQAQKSDLYLAALGILLTAVYIAGLLLRRPKRILGIGVDSLIVLVLYILGIIGLVAIAHAK